MKTISNQTILERQALEIELLNNNHKKQTQREYQYISFVVVFILSAILLAL